MTDAAVNTVVMSSGEMWGWAAVAFGGFLGAAFFAGAETGVYSINRVRLRVRAARVSPPDRSARLLSGEVAHLHNVLPALLIGYILFSAINAYGLTEILTALGYNGWWLIGINVVIVTPVLFTVADILPKELFRADADRLMYRLGPVVKLWRVVLTWTGVLPVVQFLSRLLARVLTRKASVDTELQQSRTHIHALLKEGARHGVMSESQITLLDRAFGLRETEVGDEMAPWSRCRVLQADWGRERVLAYIQQYPFTRFPLKDEGRLVGVVEYLDVCLYPEKPLVELAKPATRLAAAVPVRDALRSLAAAGAKMGVVVEQGRPIGLVTVKDLVEPLTGELKAW